MWANIVRCEIIYCIYIFFHNYQFPAASLQIPSLSFHTFLHHSFYLVILNLSCNSPIEAALVWSFSFHFTISMCGSLAFFCTPTRHTSQVSFNKFKRGKNCDPQRRLVSQWCLWQCCGPICNHASLYLDMLCCLEQNLTQAIRVNCCLVKNYRPQSDHFLEMCYFYSRV